MSSLAPSPSADVGDEARLRAIVHEHFEGLYWFIRRLGIREADIEDVVQEVIFVAARRMADIGPGKEKSFLFSTAFRIASDLRRKGSTHREIIDKEGTERDQEQDPAPGADQLLDTARARAMLEAVLSGMPLELRSVFVLYEIDEHTMSEIASLLELAPGTVASRLRRARAHFEQEVARLREHREGSAIGHERGGGDRHGGEA